MIGELLSDAGRFVRWAYPGLLLLALIHLGRTDGIFPPLKLPPDADVLAVFALTVGAVIASSLIFTLYRYFIHISIQLLLYCLGCSDVAKYARLEKKDRRLRLHRVKMPNGFFEWRNEFILQDAYRRENDVAYRRYMEGRDLLWGITHGAGITIIMFLLSMRYIEPNSILGLLSDGWKWGGISALIIGWGLLMLMNMVVGRNIARLLHRSLF